MSESPVTVDTLTVEDRGQGRWSVVDSWGWWLDPRTGKWAQEGAERGKEWVTRHTFTSRSAAMQAAQFAAENIAERRQRR